MFLISKAQSGISDAKTFTKLPQVSLNRTSNSLAFSFVLAVMLSFMKGCDLSPLELFSNQRSTRELQNGFLLPTKMFNLPVAEFWLSSGCVGEAAGAAPGAAEICSVVLGVWCMAFLLSVIVSKILYFCLSISCLEGTSRERKYYLACSKLRVSLSGSRQFIFLIICMVCWVLW